MTILIGILICLVFAFFVISIVGYVAFRKSNVSENSMDMGFLSIKDDRFGYERNTNYLLFIDPTIKDSNNRFVTNRSERAKLFSSNKINLSLIKRICLYLLISISGIVSGYILYKLYSLLI